MRWRGSSGEIWLSRYRQSQQFHCIALCCSCCTISRMPSTSTTALSRIILGAAILTSGYLVCAPLISRRVVNYRNRVLKIRLQAAEIVADCPPGGGMDM